MQIVRGNAVADLRRVPDWLVKRIRNHLSIPVPVGTKAGSRFGSVWWYEGQPYGSLLHRSGDSLHVPAGLTPHCERLAALYGVPSTVVDVRERPAEQKPLWSVQAPWRPYQDRVQAAAIANPVGVIDAPPRSGKTLMAARLLDSLGHPALYIAPSVQIVRQTHDVFSSYFGSDFVGRFDGAAAKEDRDLSRHIVVATAQSAVRLPKTFFDSRNVLVIDEFHHSAAELYHRLNLLAENVFFRYGLTGTHFRSGDDSLAMEAICSQTIATISIDELIPNFLAEPRVFFLPVRGKIDAADFAEAYELGIVEHGPRNDRVIAIAKELQTRGVPTIILTRRRAHADAIGAALDDAVVVKGGENVLTSKSVRAFLDGRYSTMIGTTVIGEGVDVPRAAALIYACGGNDGVSMMQSYFRPLTAFAGKDAGRIYDFVDKQHATLRRQSTNRMRMAAQQFGATRVLRFE